MWCLVVGCKIMNLVWIIPHTCVVLPISKDHKMLLKFHFKKKKIGELTFYSWPNCLQCINWCRVFFLCVFFFVCFFSSMKLVFRFPSLQTLVNMILDNIKKFQYIHMAHYVKSFKLQIYAFSNAAVVHFVIMVHFVLLLQPHPELVSSWPWSDTYKKGVSDARYRYSCTSLKHPRKCIGFTRRRIGRGGR